MGRDGTAVTERGVCVCSCWFYKQHGRTAAFTMSEVAPDLVDARWYDEIRYKAHSRSRESSVLNIAGNARLDQYGI
eukprot:3068678-Rhodomonas_salina.1